MTGQEKVDAWIGDSIWSLLARDFAEKKIGRALAVRAQGLLCSNQFMGKVASEAKLTPLGPIKHGNATALEAKLGEAYRLSGFESAHLMGLGWMEWLWSNYTEEIMASTLVLPAPMRQVPQNHRCSFPPGDSLIYQEK